MNKIISFCSEINNNRLSDLSPTFFEVPGDIESQPFCIDQKISIHQIMQPFACLIPGNDEFVRDLDFRLISNHLNSGKHRGVSRLIKSLENKPLI